MDYRKVIGLFALCAILLCSCSRKIYLPVENTVVRTDTAYTYKLRVDSVIMRDSVAIFQKGDTVTITKYRDRYRLKLLTDTVYQSVTDSVKVSVPYPVERELTRWEKAKMDFGGAAMGALLIALCILAVWLIKKYKK